MASNLRGVGWYRLEQTLRFIIPAYTTKKHFLAVGNTCNMLSMLPNPAAIRSFAWWCRYVAAKTVTSYEESTFRAAAFVSEWKVGLSVYLSEVGIRG